MLMLASTLGEQTTGLYQFTLVDDEGNGLHASQIEALTLTYYDVATGAAINNRDGQDVLNTNNVTLVTVEGPPMVTTITWMVQPEDSVIVDDQWSTEIHAVLFRWTWDSGTRHGAYDEGFGVTNMHRPQPVA